MSDVPPSSRSAGPRPGTDFELTRPAKSIIAGSLGVVAGEQVVILVDRARVGLGQALVEAATSLGARVSSFVLEDVAPRPVTSVPAVLETALRRAQVSVLLIGVEHRDEVTFRTSFVRITEEARVRHAHVLGLTRSSFVSSFNVEPGRITEMVHAVHLRVLGKRKLRYTTPAGTNLEIRMGDDTRWFERAELIAPGKWANLPAGELIALAENVDGVFVADASMNVALSGTADLRSQPLTFTIEGGVCVQIDAADKKLVEAARAHVASEEKLDRVGHIVLGANPGLSGPIGEMVHDQCVPGLHVVFGWTNQKVTRATWSTSSILAVNSRAGDIDVDGAPLLRAGRYLL
jgi:aminopeptidase